VGFDI
jgi:hypothetical protein